MRADSTSAQYTAPRCGESTGATGRTWRSLLSFPSLSTKEIPCNAQIISASLSLVGGTDYSTTASNYRIYRMKRSWTSAATWNNYDGTNAWTSAGAFHANDCEQTGIGLLNYAASGEEGKTRLMSLTPGAIQGMVSGSFINNGFLLKSDTELNDAWSLSGVVFLYIVYSIQRTRRGIDLLGRHERRLVY